MTLISRAGAVSHVGRVRSNNQDSGFVGDHLFAVADGMGGHAGGDVASAIAAKHFAEHDVLYETPEAAAEGLAAMLVEANSLIVEAVEEHPELRGMGTTASCLAFVDGRLVIGHIGDSRIYRLHGGEMTQITADHTFVQKLVDAGRITPEEALVHPRRSVLMKVLGDVETKPECDTEICEAVDGDRWLLCSDGLSSYVEEDDILQVLSRMELSSREVCDDLVQLALDNGAPDNVTVVVLEVGEKVLEPMTTRLVGSAANELRFGKPAKRRHSPISAVLDPLRRTPPARPEDEEYIPPTDEFLDQLIAEERRRKRTRLVLWWSAIFLLVAAVFGAGALAYNWTQTRYYVGESEGNVAIYQGVQQQIGPIELSHVVEVSDVPVSALSEYQRTQVEQTINVDTLEHAQDLVGRLRETTP
ncbi:PP2C-family Ser/Thr phosphatase [Pseudoclavibacter triregionum]|nr:PP2C-family Ser/Thr phosphatase [Pseudoclavibacter triregionum]